MSFNHDKKVSYTRANVDAQSVMRMTLRVLSATIDQALIVDYSGKDWTITHAKNGVDF